MPRAKFLGFIAVLAALVLGGLFAYSVFAIDHGGDVTNLNNYTLSALATPIFLVSFFVIGTGFWIGYTILTIKVVPPMPEIVEKKDLSKLKAFFLCLLTLAIAAALVYGIYIKSYWALAVPAAIISFVILGAVLWVGIAILTTRATLPEEEA
ncbi:MAG: hypothetical protein GY754_41250 [bacterium]|nr:hypothetical protein [bacterium]